MTMTEIYNNKLELISMEMRGVLGKQQEYQVHTREGRFAKVKFIVKRIIGRGSFGIVSQIELDGRSHALKSVYQDNRYCNREVDILLEISHRNVILLKSYFYTHRNKTGHFLNIITEYMPLVFEDVLKFKGHPIKTLRHFMKQLFSGLRYLHGLGIAHRDVKPANILLDPAFNLKIADFGSAKRLKEGEANISYICSRYYRAPENLMDCRNYSTLIDIWAAGAIFCEARMPDPIFSGESTDAVLNKIVNIFGNKSSILSKCMFRNPTPPGITHVLEQYFDSSALIDVLACALLVDPTERYRAEDLLNLPFFISE